jgi:glycosyltransferase involved in cell wall biosynthesis
MPSAPFTIAFATNSVPMTGRTPWEASLGGSESAMVCMARALAARGHDVEVYTRCAVPGDYDGVQYHDISSLKQHAKARDWDVFIALRFPAVLMEELRAGLKILWCQDVLSDRASRPMLDNLIPHLDRFLFVSEWHRKDTLRILPEIETISWVTRNPIWEDSIPISPPAALRNPLLVHLSRPERGLQPLLDCWPRIKEKFPEARLAVARYRSFHEPRGGQVEAFCLMMDERVRELEGAEHLGNLDKPSLYRVLGQAALMVYPAEFDETSCIAAIESQACGTPIVTTPRGALPETIHPEAGIFVPPGPDFQKRFTEEVVRLLQNPERRQQLAQAGLAHAPRFFASRIAEEWEASWIAFFEDRATRYAASIRASLAAYGNQTDHSGLIPAPTASWPGVGQALHTLLQRHLSAPASLAILVPSGAEADAALISTTAAFLDPNTLPTHIEAAVVLDLGGLLLQSDRKGWLERLNQSVRSGTRIVHLLPSGHHKDGSPGCQQRQVDPTYSDIASWFPHNSRHDLTVEASSQHGKPLRCWVVSYRANEVCFGADNPKLKAVRTRPSPRISVCMIVRNEERHILRSLHSTLPIAAEYCIVDTGSKDSTCELIKSFARSSPVPVRLVSIPWPDDFSAARNHSMNLASGDWIFWIDADEELIGAEQIRRAVESEWYEAFAIRQHNLIFDRGVTQVEIPLRLFRHGRGYRFFGCIHEHPEVALNESIEPWVPLAGADILHTGYLTEAGRLKKCLQRNLALLHRDRQLNPERKLTRILYLRDCINLAHLDLRQQGVLSDTNRAELLASVDDFEQSFLKDRDKWYRLGREYYDRGLELLSQGRGFAIRLEGPGLEAITRQHYFRDPADFLRILMEAGHETLHRLGYQPVEPGGAV